MPVRSVHALRDKRRLTRDWHTVFCDDEDEDRLNKFQQKNEIDELLLESNFDVTNFTYADINYITGSSYEGQISKVGLDGGGTYTFPHGVRYEGQFRDGMFHGKGFLIYPRGQSMNCTFNKGRMVEWEFLFSCPSSWEDEHRMLQSSKYDSPSSELVTVKTSEDMDIATYCQPPDRRFHISCLEGLQGAPKENLTNNLPTRGIRKGCYDLEDGFYDPKIKWVVSAQEKEKILYMTPEKRKKLSLATETERRKFISDIPNVPIYQTESWILTKCRKSWDENVGYRPDLYEYWFSGRQKHREALKMAYTEDGGNFVKQESGCEEGLKSFNSQSKRELF